MKSVADWKNIALAALLGGMLAAPALAQPGPGIGGGPRMQNAAPGAGGGMGRGMRFSQDNTPGWTLMTPAEQAAHREKMLSMQTYADCKAYQTEHRAVMEARARERGVTLPAARQPGCERMQARGLLK